MASYSGSITTSGKSEAIRLEKSLFRQHPEFRQQSKVRAHVIAPGHLLVCLADEEENPAEQVDPVMGAFLAFLAGDVQQHPARIAPVSESLVSEARRLTEAVEASDSDDIPDDVSF